MIKYQRPSLTAFQSRKVFHSCERTQTESAIGWLQRIKYTMETCDYGALNEIMFIDKFLSGLNNDDFGRLSQLSVWSEEQFRLLLSDNNALDDRNFKRELADSATDFVPAPDVLIKEEISNDHIDFHFASIDENQMLDGCGYDDSKGDIGSEPDLPHENESIQSAHLHIRNTFERKPALKRKRWTKEKDPRMFVCQVCGIDCLYLSKLRRHMKKHQHSNKTFECYLCGFLYQRLGGLKIHFMKTHFNDETGKLNCVKNFLEQDALDQHKEIHLHDEKSQTENSLQKEDVDNKPVVKSDSLPNNKKPVTCKLKPAPNQVKVVKKNLVKPPKTILKGYLVNKSNGSIHCLDCDKHYKQINAYNQHKRIMHSGIQSYKCNICGKRFGDQTLLNSHHVLHKHQNGTFECYLCATKYERWLNLRIHFIKLHTPRLKRNFKCTFCSKTFVVQRDLNVHIKIHRGLAEGHKCQQCGKVFDTKTSLNKHLVMHLKTREFICETCGRSYKSDNHLKQHATIHNADRRFKCTECGQVLSSTSTLKNHMRQHTGERPLSCHLCGKSFCYPSVLYKHLRLHRNERPHGCTLCDKKFATAYHLKRHMNTHTGARLYACNQCDRSFMQSGTLKAHQLKIHATMPPMN